MVARVEIQKVNNNHHKRKFNGGNQGQQKKHQVEKVYAVTLYLTPTQQRSYIGNKSLCTKCNRHHIGECFHYALCNKKGHIANFYPTTTLAATIQDKGTGSGSGGGGTCYECREKGHFKKYFPKLRKGDGIARGRAFVIGNKNSIQDPSIVTGTFLINNLYATILFDSGADRSFITPSFKQLLDHESSKLDVAYEVEVAHSQIERTTEILCNCVLTMNDHTFPVNLIPMPIGSFGIIIGMD
ncbi:uncharacterized protein LOC111921452 [Lactuca sativa]|uniref:uncharacterized protein LOC111921452 n=1 Tax=Lactuca sativa TaxID=4236 RepID=UPI000CD9A5F6|nr:uncharacterized protein LOC111921452 [Lactuca sativa]